jgi:anthranilate synthase component 2
MKVLIIDNYDSFTYNLYQVVGEILESGEHTVEVFRNNNITLKQIQQFNYDRIILSPGPGSPADKKYFGVCADILQRVQNIPILGVCLGMQGMAYYFGGEVIPAKQMMHGKTSTISHDGKGVFSGIPQKIQVMRYHSLVADSATLPACLKITATADKDIMGLRHTTLPIEGVQFHPESFATEAGKQMLENFLCRGGI